MIGFVLGDAKKQVHMEGYAVSGQCMALVRDDCLVPTKDAPELGYVRESSDKQFVPDVYYKVSSQLTFYRKRPVGNVENMKSPSILFHAFVLKIYFLFFSVNFSEDSQPHTMKT